MKEIQKDGPVDIFTEKKDINELPAGHGMSELNAPVPPQEMEGSPVILSSLGDNPGRSADV